MKTFTDNTSINRIEGNIPWNFQPFEILSTLYKVNTCSIEFFIIFVCLNLAVMEKML